MLSTLNVSQTGLNAAKIAVENVSNNIANESTPGYKKRVVQLSELSQMDSQFTGRGVNASGAYRITSQYMYDKLISENTKSNYYDKLSNMLSNVESIFAETTDSGLSADLDRYYQAVENLRTNPNSQIYKTTLENQGSIVVESLQNLYTSIEKQQQTEKKELGANVNDVNSILKEIGSLNEKIEKFGETNDLLDKRDQLELQLSNYADISVIKDSGYYELTLGGQTAISNNTNIRTLNVVEENSLQKDKFNYTKFNDLTKVTDVFDPLKYNSDGTPRTNAIDANDIVTYKLNNEFEVSVTMGESLTADWDNDSSTADTTQVIDLTNLTRALVFKINANSDMKDSITAYNGDYRVDANGNKLTDNNQDNFLRIESNFGGVSNQFDGRISIEKRDNTDSTIVDSREIIYKNDSESATAETKVYVAINDKEIPIKSGSLKAQVENLSSDSSNNKYQVYLDKLNSFAQTLADVSNKYIQTGTNSYIYGEAATNESLGVINSTGLFNGSNIKTLKFNKDLVSDLTQNKLDYLATIQWKNDLSFDGKGQNITSSNKSSLGEFFRDLKVNVSSDKEGVDFSKTTQLNVTMSIKSTYDQLTKVDKDEEMLNLIKFQAAYTANAKMITVIDEMLQTLLGLKR
ncbi:MAG: flagellar basal body rod C-terminal domain-containing protein [Aliarcobacter sp.]|nr:flagellar basal body rod C-terminal domain-containing protein [Aliarcobacter sp.]